MSERHEDGRLDLAQDDGSESLVLGNVATLKMCDSHLDAVILPRPSGKVVRTMTVRTTKEDRLHGRYQVLNGDIGTRYLIDDAQVPDDRARHIARVPDS